VATDFDTDAVVREVARVLMKKFPTVEPGKVEAVVREEVQSFEQRPVRDFIGVLAQREAKHRLKHLTKVSDAPRF
jgi:hypothetical protein